jgi:hypothetical protein
LGCAARGFSQFVCSGFELRLKRMREYYLPYGEVGFQAGAINAGLRKLAPSR